MMSGFFQKIITRKRRSCNGGFTLVEVIVTLIITVIVIAISSTLLITGTNMFARSAQRDIQQNIAETVLSFVSDQLLYAYHIDQKAHLTTGVPEDDYANANGAVLQVMMPDGSTRTGGYLHFRRDNDNQAPVNVFGSNFYGNYTITLNLDIQARTTSASAYFTLTVTVVNSLGADVLSRTTTKPLLNYSVPSRNGLNAYGNMTVSEFIDINPRA